MFEEKKHFERVRALLAAEVGEVAPCAACGNVDSAVPRALFVRAGARVSSCLDGHGCLARQGGARPITTYHELVQHFEDLGAEPCSECDWSLNEIRDYVNIVVAAKEAVRLKVVVDWRVAGAQKAWTELAEAVARYEVGAQARRTLFEQEKQDLIEDLIDASAGEGERTE